MGGAAGRRLGVGVGFYGLHTHHFLAVVQSGAKLVQDGWEHLQQALL